MSQVPPHDPSDLDNTQPVTVTRVPPPPPLGRGHVQPLPGRRKRGERLRDKRKRSGAVYTSGTPGRPTRRPPQENGLYLPAWSVMLMLVLVFSIAGGVILLVLVLGGQSPPGGSPRVVIVTAFPSVTPGNLRATLVLPTASPVPPGALPTFALEGDIPPTVVLTPTPDAIAIEKWVRVVNVGERGLRIRSAPSVESEANVLYIASEGDMFRVLEGPVSEDGLTWWRLRPFESANTQEGWAVENDGNQDVLAVAGQAP